MVELIWLAAWPTAELTCSAMLAAGSAGVAGDCDITGVLSTALDACCTCSLMLPATWCAASPICEGASVIVVPIALAVDCAEAAAVCRGFGAANGDVGRGPASTMGGSGKSGDNFTFGGATVVGTTLMGVGMAGWVCLESVGGNGRAGSRAGFFAGGAGVVGVVGAVDGAVGNESAFGDTTVGAGGVVDELVIGGAAMMGVSMVAEAG